MEQNKNPYYRKKSVFEKAGDVVEEFMNGFVAEFVVGSLAQMVKRKKSK